MGIHIEIDFTPRQKKVVRVAIVAGTVIAALGIGIAFASPHQWTSGDTLKSADLNSLNVVSVAVDGGTVQYSVGATKYCGISSGNFTGLQVGGYVGAKAVCQQACNSPTAHMCTAEEMTRSWTLGIHTPKEAWYSNGVNGPGTGLRDCVGWTSNSNTIYGPANDLTNGVSDGPGGVTCNTSIPIHCCD